MTLANRGVGWLDSNHHAEVRELLCHALSRYRLICPAYCLMPDHGHFLWLGVGPASDQKGAVSLFRRAWAQALEPTGHVLQRQAYDHVLRQEERQHGAFQTVAHYIFNNPIRAGLVEDWTKYPYLGAVVPGYPDMHPRAADFWEKFWRIYAKVCGERGENLTVSATTDESPLPKG
jgi:putative transposase